MKLAAFQTTAVHLKNIDRCKFIFCRSIFFQFFEIICNLQIINLCEHVAISFEELRILGDNTQSGSNNFLMDSQVLLTRVHNPR